MNAALHLSPGLLLAVGAALDAHAHRHHAMQVVWPAGACELELAGAIETGPQVVAAGVEHRLSMAHGLIMLAEPQSDWGERLAAYLGGRESRGLAGMPELARVVGCAGDVTRVLPHLATALGWAGWNGLGESAGAGTDDRIARLLAGLDGCFTDRCLKPEQWRAEAVAASLNLSEGRFLHLFREQMGIAWRPYLLWRRLLCAVRSMGRGASATEAAHEAGFSDSAHLSRTFRKSFGLSVRQAQAMFR